MKDKSSGSRVDRPIISGLVVQLSAPPYSMSKGLKKCRERAIYVIFYSPTSTLGASLRRQPINYTYCLLKVGGPVLSVSQLGTVADMEGQEFLLKDGAVHMLLVQRNREKEV